MSNVDQLASFSGYYSLDIAPGAFLSIDTTETPLATSQISPPPLIPSVVVSVSLDGKSSAAYPFTGDATFDGVTLTIPEGKIMIKLTRNYDNGKLVSFSGNVNGTIVTGFTYYNPVPLSSFSGEYTNVSTNKTAISITSDRRIYFDFSVFSGGPGTLTPVTDYIYVPGMFVVTFAGRDQDPTNFTLMFGTDGKSGLACSIQRGTKALFAVTIPTPP